MNKASYRKIYKEKRLSLSSEDCLILDKGLLERFKTLDFNEVEYLHIYLSIDRLKEPDTLSFIQFLKVKYPRIQFVISKTDFHSNTMLNYIWDDDLVLEENKLGILEPTGGYLLKEDLIDMVIVPLLVADKVGNRVGYGKGFYDKFLANCKPNVQKIGISYFEPVDRIEDIDDWDIGLDQLVTPQKVYKY